MDSARKPDRLAAAVKNITCPMLLVRGRMSDVISEDSVRKFLELQPSARFIDIARAGHMVAGDANDVFTEAVTTFLDELR
jgi:pimeloyl-ACP methyl ester carboxylesterase